MRSWLTTEVDTSLRAYGFYRRQGWTDWKIERDLRWMEISLTNRRSQRPHWKKSSACLPRHPAVAYLYLVDMAVDLSMGKKSCVRVFASLAWKPGAGLRRLESVGVS